VILFFGPPGSGKSVQGQLLVERNNWKWLSTGQMFRDSEDPEVLEKLKSGELIDDELTNKVVSQALQDVDTNNHVILDGYPRNPTQAKWLEAHLPQHGREIRAAIVFETPQDELVRRLAGRGRTEDTPAVIQRRLEIYAKNTKPVLDYFANSGVQVIEIDGLGSVEEVHERIQEAVQACIPA
jgi:adenylate kinase